MKNRYFFAIALITALAGSACSPTPLAAPVYSLAPLEEDSAAPTPAPAQAVAVPEYYQVSKGDTLIAIAMHYDLDHGELARWNNLRNPDLIQPGQRLRLIAPPQDPAVAAVPKQRAPALQPLNAQDPSVVTESANKPGAPASRVTIQRQSTLINNSAAAATTAAIAPGTAPYKKRPLATKYAYSPKLLKTLRQEWQAQQGAAQSAPAAQSAAATTAAANAAAAAPKKAASTRLAATRQTHGITWGLPSEGKVIARYSGQNKGVDFAGKKGDPVYAAADGTVIYVGTGVKSYGRLIILRHDNNYLSAYAHNDAILVKEDQQIKRGVEIATMGDSGSDRVMLHFEVRKSGKPFNPAEVLPQ